MKNQHTSFDEAVKKIDQRIAEFYLRVNSLHSLSSRSSTSKISPSTSGKSGKASAKAHRHNHHDMTVNLAKIIERMCRQEKKKIKLFYPNHNTQHRYFTKYRNALPHQDIPEIWEGIIRHHLRLEDAESEARSRLRDEHIDWRTNHVTLFEAPVFLQNCREFLDRSLGELQEQGRTDRQKDLLADPAFGRVPSHPAFYTLLIGLLGLTGRRPIEVLKTGAFRWEDPLHVLFSGQTKTKGSTQGRDSYPIPVLDDAQKIVRGLEMIRRILPLSSWENERVGQTFSGRIARHLRPLQLALLPESPHLLNVRSLRSLYVTTAYELFNMRERSSFNAFAARVLGHSHLDKNTANCYTYFALRSRLPERDGPAPKKNRVDRRKS